MIVSGTRCAGDEPFLYSIDELVDTGKNRLPILQHMVERFPNDWKNFCDRVMNDPVFESEDQRDIELVFGRRGGRPTLLEALEDGVGVCVRVCVCVCGSSVECGGADGLTRYVVV